MAHKSDEPRMKTASGAPNANAVTPTNKTLATTHNRKSPVRRFIFALI
jgi:hypothetical protein